MAPSEIEIKIKCARATLKILRRDINHICNVGSAATQGDGKLLPNFKAMYPRAITLVEEYSNEFKSVLTAAISAEAEDLFPLEEDYKLRTEVNTLYYQCVQLYQAITPTAASFNSGSVSQSTTLTRSRLPKISLPTFSGIITEWPKFKQLFLSMIHDNDEVPVLERFHYLTTSLSGEPLTVISAYAINEANYPLAWSALLNRYDNKRLLATTYITKMFDYKPLSYPSLQSLQSFIAVVAENVHALRALELPDDADFIWLTLALSKLDRDTRQRYESHVISDEWPTFRGLVEFVQGRSKVLQLAGGDMETPVPGIKGSRYGRSAPRARVLATTDQTTKPAGRSVCSCSVGHALFDCPVFKDKTPNRRRAFLSGKRICFICLRPNHLASTCSSTRRCGTCSGRHHSLLHESLGRFGDSSSHLESKPPRGHVTPSLEPSSPSINPPVVASVTGPSQVLLGTAVALIPDSAGELQPVRLLLDCASQVSLITSSCARRLGLAWRATRHRPLGAGQVVLPKVMGALQCSIHSQLDDALRISAQPLVVASITGSLPTFPITARLDHLISKGCLADPTYWKPAPIDLLLGNDVLMSVLQGPVKQIQTGLGALDTIFGLVLMGNLGAEASPGPLSCLSLIDAPLSDEMMCRFWEMEQVETPSFDASVDECEEHFQRTHYRDTSGRYVVALPFRSGIEMASDLSASKPLALSRFNKLMGKFSRDSDLKLKYSQFMKEYCDLGHMSRIVSQPKYVIPHHAVFGPGGKDSKIRVVFDASMKTPVGSLNDWLKSGPKLQRDVADIIMSFRLFKIALTTDLVKMYRQILVTPEHRPFQCIWWRSCEDSCPELYECNTVTYGITSAAFQAIRVVKQLAADEGHAYPHASKVLEEDIYVDDVVTGADTVEDAKRLRDELIGLLGKGGFLTHKWKTSSPELAEHLGELAGTSELQMTPEDSVVTKILGMAWNPHDDCFFYDVKLPNFVVTKRSILSTVARLFDPMGFLAPVTFFAKCIMQRLWSARVGWDEEPDAPLRELWVEFARSLSSLTEISIPRYCLSDSYLTGQLLGFCDASQKGFAAVLYLRTVTANGGVNIFLVKSKTRVAPLKTVSIPRLELAGAHLLCKLWLSVSPLFIRMSLDDPLLFTDSTIVLSWLQLSPHLLQTYVGNRVSFIISHTNPAQWRHVPSADNPADVASRGLMPFQLKADPLWWAGPEWLRCEPPNLPASPVASVDIPELRVGVTLSATVREADLGIWIERHSKYYPMLRSLAYVRRFINNTRLLPRLCGSLSPTEIENALLSCVKVVQRQCFSTEFSWDTNIAKSKRLLALSVFCDADGLLRVGGRLQNANISLDCKSPLILPGHCHLVSLLVDHFHEVHFHLGNLALEALLRRRFWIFRLRQVVRGRIRRCLICQRMRAQPYLPIMAPLPSARVVPGRPFLSVGVDYAGPFGIKLSSRRNAPLDKAYLCLFVCMVTRAVHLECVSSLSTDAFLAALDRFVSRRGIPAQIFSDCGRNFVGASRKLRELSLWMGSKNVQVDLNSHATSRGFKWHFNPPYAPHFGGFWEAAVKSVKFHMYRVLRERSLTFEELSTFFNRVEAILNSRPIASKDYDTSNPDVLTPGHFLIGSPLLAVPETDVTVLPLNSLSRWQLVQNAVRHVWKRWHSEYLHTLQQRSKWRSSSQSLMPGDIVLIADPSSMPTRWPLARVMECHPGSDNVTRVVTIKSSHGIQRRAVHKLVPLKHLNSIESDQ